MGLAGVNLESLRKYKYQILATLTVNIITISHGHATAWLAPALPLLQSDNSPLSSGPMSVEEASWLGALLCCGGLIGSFGFGMFVNQIGRKKCLYVLTIPHSCFWLMVIFGSHVQHLYLARILSGMAGGGIFVVIPTFVADIADNKIRGTLGSMLLIFFNAGVLSGFVLGSYLSYSLFPRIIVGSSVLYILAIYRLPDTPQYLLQVEKDAEAEESLKFYRNYQAASKDECRDFDEYLANLKNRIHGSADCKATAVTLKDFMQPAAVTGLCAGLGLMFLNQFSGLFALINYTVNIFKMSGSTMNPNTCTIIVGAIQLLGTFFAANYVDRVGRRPLLITSCLGVTVGSFALATYSYLSLGHDLTHLSWIAVTSVSITILLGSVGITPLAVVVLTEILPQKVKAILMTVCMCSLTVMAFTVLKVYPVLMELVGVHGVMWICGGITLLSAVVIYFFLPETKGKCLEVKDTPT